MASFPWCSEQEMIIISRVSESYQRREENIFAYLFFFSVIPFSFLPIFTILASKSKKLNSTSLKLFRTTLAYIHLS